MASSSLTGIELHEACSEGDHEYVEQLLRTGKFNVNLKDPDWEERTPLHWACAVGNVQCINLLLARGADGSSCMAMGWTPAHVAAEAGKLSVLCALHDHGVPVDKTDIYGDTPLHIAEIYDHTDCVQYLQELKAEEQRIRSQEVRTPLGDAKKVSRDGSTDDVTSLTGDVASKH